MPHSIKPSNPQWKTSELCIILPLGHYLTSMTIKSEFQVISPQSSSECMAFDIVACTASKYKKFVMMIYHHQISLLGLQNVTTLCLEKQQTVG